MATRSKSVCCAGLWPHLPNKFIAAGRIVRLRVLRPNSELSNTMKITRPTIFVLVSLLASIASPTFAVVDLDASNPDTPVYARETLSELAVTLGAEDGVAYYTVNESGTTNDIVAKLGVSFVASDRFYIRFTLGNGVLAEGHAASLQVDGGSADVVLSLGGNTGDSFVIFAVTSTVPLDQTALVELNLDQLAISATGATAISYELYTTASNALYETGSFYRRELATYIRTAASASASFTPGNNVADVDKAFLGFTSSSISEQRANVGQLDYKVGSDILAANDGLQVELVDFVNEAATTVTLQGDFSFGVWTLDDDPNCASPDVTLEIDESELGSTEARLADFGSSGYNSLCVEVDGVSDVIPAEEYLAAAEPEKLFSSQLFSASKFSGAVGLLEQNGTVVRIPHLTTFSDYRQRLVLVNNRDLPIDYSLHFITEEDVVATPLDAATGVLPPNTTVVLQVADVVLIDGGNRCSATLSATARVGSVSVATTQVNLLDGSTDTVVY